MVGEGAGPKRRRERQCEGGKAEAGADNPAETTRKRGDTEEAARTEGRGAHPASTQKAKEPEKAPQKGAKVAAGAPQKRPRDATTKPGGAGRRKKKKSASWVEFGAGDELVTIGKKRSNTLSGGRTGSEKAIRT
ncbi:hypothetical protein COOONC_11633 [Cooperia oncophora]